jgi:2-iminobutanoate/2-iminopropanoate deaminase
MAVLAQAYNRRELEKSVGYSQAILSGDFLFVSGCAAWDLDVKVQYTGDFPAQLKAVYADIDATLKAHGLGPADVVKETVFTTDMDAMVAANPARVAYYHGVIPPAGTWVEIKRLVDPDMMVEIEVVARLTTKASS